MALTTVVSNEDLVVLGPPSSVSVAVDIGPKGEAGSQFYSGVGTPAQNAASLVDAKINDLYTELRDNRSWYNKEPFFWNSSEQRDFPTVAPLALRKG